MFSHTCRVCSVMSPIPAIDPSDRRAVIPETKTSRPFASTTVACENTPTGFLMASDETSRLGMSTFLCVLTKIRIQRLRRNAQVSREPYQHGGNRRVEFDLAGRTLALSPFRLARCEDRADARRATG